MANGQGRRLTCPRCGTEVDAGGGIAHQPGVVSCPGCGGEIPFAPDAGGLADRTALADPTHPERAGGAPGGATATCQSCGAAVPLRGVTPTERGGEPGDIADTMTCPSCGVEVAAVADQG